jgi:hypothetical protein
MEKVMTWTNVPFKDIISLAIGFAMIMAAFAWLFGALVIAQSDPAASAFWVAYNTYASPLAGAYLGFSAARAVWQNSGPSMCLYAVIIVSAYAAVWFYFSFGETPAAIMTPFLLAMGVFLVRVTRRFVAEDLEQGNNPE